jgi:hypothetical protein
VIAIDPVPLQRGQLHQSRLMSGTANLPPAPSQSVHLTVAGQIMAIFPQWLPTAIGLDLRISSSEFLPCASERHICYDTAGTSP